MNNQFILAGCSRANEVKIFDTKADNKSFTKITKLREAIYTCAFANNSHRFAFAGGDGQLYIS